MKFVWKGKFTGYDQLPIGHLPENAVRYEEPETVAELSKKASWFLIPVGVFVLVIVLLRRLFFGEFPPFDISLFGVFIAFLMIMPHEFLHGIVFPKGAEVEVYYSIKNMMAFVISTHPTSKNRFIFLSALPNVVFGVLPLILWLVLPSEFVKLGQVLFTFGAVSMTFGVGDFMNIYNTIRQVPAGGMTQLSGFHSYWFMPVK